MIRSAPVAAVFLATALLAAGVGAIARAGNHPPRPGTNRTVANDERFSISGGPQQPLDPGMTLPLDLTVTNDTATAIEITALHVSVSPNTGNPACDGTLNFATTPLRSSILVPPHTTSSLSKLGIPTSRQPTLTFLNLPSNQDDCKDSRITLKYVGTSVGP